MSKPDECDLVFSSESEFESTEFIWVSLVNNPHNFEVTKNHCLNK